MARTVEEIQISIEQAIQENPVLKDKFTSISNTAIFKVFIYIVAFSTNTLEKLLDYHKVEVQEDAKTKKPHKLLWYRNMALKFQYGLPLVLDSDYYETDSPEARIIKFAATTESEDANGAILKIKVAKGNTGSLAELSPVEIAAFTYYINRVKDAGVRIRVVSQEADRLGLELDVYYNPLVLDSSGARLDGTNDTPVQDAIQHYLQTLPFDGEYTNIGLVDALQEIEGIKIPQLRHAQARWGEYDWKEITARYNPEAGWLNVFSEDLTINWIVHV